MKQAPAALVTQRCLENGHRASPRGLGGHVSPPDTPLLLLLLLAGNRFRAHSPGGHFQASSSKPWLQKCHTPMDALWELDTRLEIWQHSHSFPVATQGITAKYPIQKCLIWIVVHYRAYTFISINVTFYGTLFQTFKYKLLRSKNCLKRVDT